MEYWETKRYWIKEAFKALALMICVGVFVFVLLLAGCGAKNIHSTDYYNKVNSNEETNSAN